MNDKRGGTGSRAMRVNIKARLGGNTCEASSPCPAFSRTGDMLLIARNGISTRDVSEAAEREYTHVSTAGRKGFLLLRGVLRD